jgi:RNA polymerase sigma-70 factor (ECF subfamily)
MSAAAWPVGRTLPQAGRCTRSGRRPTAATSSQLPAGAQVARGAVVPHTAHPMPVHARDSEAADEDLMLRYAAGDATAFDVLYDRHKGGVFRYLLRHGSGNSAEELAHDVWASLIRVRAQYQATAKFTTYLYRLAHNRLIDFYRAEGRAEFVSRDGDEAADDLVAAQAGPRGEQPEVQVESRDIAQRIRAALGALPDVQREAFLLQQEGGLSVAEIAEATGVPEETAKSRLRYAITKLRAQLKDLL